MKSKSFLIYLVFLLIAAISFFVSINLILPRFVWINESLHSTAEAFGAMAAIFMAIILLHRKHEEGGYVVYCPELDITTEGETIEEAVYMLKDAATGYIEVVGLENIPHFSKAHQIQELELVING